MIRFKTAFFCIALIFILSACNDPVFYAISEEVKPKEPLVKGSPSNFAVYNSCMYVASGENLFSYNIKNRAKPDYWKIETRPGGNIIQIASTGSGLYVLCSTDRNIDGKTVIKRYDKDNSSWAQIGGILDNYEKIQNIFSAGDKLFILATAKTTKNNIFYDILYIDDSGAPNVLNIINPDARFENGDINSGEITGAAFNGTSYFLSRKAVKAPDVNNTTVYKSGVYRIDDFSAGASLISYKDANNKDVNLNFTGIINLKDAGNTILLIVRNGDIYTVNDSINKVENISMGKMSSGALAIWTNPEKEDDPERLLLAGRQDSFTYSVSYGYRYGYMELELDSTGIKSGSNFTEPGRSPISSLIDYDRYQSTIGKQPVNYLFQAPSEIDGNMTMFASTQKGGVWSCRKRRDFANKYWNAEGENEPE